MVHLLPFYFFFFNDTATTEIYTLSLHDALPITTSERLTPRSFSDWPTSFSETPRSEEHTSELQSRVDLVCRLLLEKKKKEKDRSRGWEKRTGERTKTKSAAQS